MKELKNNVTWGMRHCIERRGKKEMQARMVKKRQVKSCGCVLTAQVVVWVTLCSGVG